MSITVCERVIIFTSMTSASVPTENYDVEELVRFLELLKTVPISYNKEECILERSLQEFIRVAGMLGFVRYKLDARGNYYYFSKGVLYNQPVVILQTISSYLPCNKVYFYGDTTVEALIDDIIKELQKNRR